MKGKVIYIPIAVMLCVTIVTLLQLIGDNTNQSYKVYTGIGLVAVNIAVYFISKRNAIYLTGLIILASLFNFVNLYINTINITLFVFSSESKLNTPKFEIRSIGLLILYIIFCWGFFFKRKLRS